MTLEQLVAYQPIGNAFSNTEALEACHVIIFDDKLPMADRITAVRQLDRIMGAEQEVVTEQDVIDYINDAN